MMESKLNQQLNRCLLSLFLTTSLFSCSKKEEDTVASLISTNNKLYVSTGICNSGTGLTTYTTTATRTLESYQLETGIHLGTLLDYNFSGTFAAATHPKNILDNGDNLFVLNENSTSTSERKIIKVPKANPLSYSNYYLNSTVLSGAMVGLNTDNEGSLLISKTTAIEKINTTPIRIPAGANPWVNAPAGNCATSTTFISSVVSLPAVSGSSAGKIIFTHQGATAAVNRIGIISSTGYFSASDCLAGVQISSVTHTKASNLASGTAAFNTNGTSPTSMVLIPYSSGTVTSKLLVSYSNGQTSNNNAGTYTLNHGLVMWDVNEPSSTTASLTNPVIVYDNTSFLYGISAMTYDADSGNLYVATSGEPGATNLTTNGYGYNIEKFSLTLSSNGTPLLNRVTYNNQPYIKGGAYTKCISGLAIGN